MPAAPRTSTRLRTPEDGLKTALAFFARHGSAKLRADMSARYGIVTNDKTFGVPMAKLHVLAKQLGRDHALAKRSGTRASTRRVCSPPSWTSPRA
jgi:hypothetical protein